jgi:AcrR family transcriptional regulator
VTPQARSAAAVGEIVRAARDRFGDQGYEATSIDEIAADVGRTKGAVYHHFVDKRALFDHVLAVEQREIAAIVARADTLSDGVTAYLRTIARRTGAARITLVDGPQVLGWARWRACDDGPFRSMLRRALDASPALADRYDLDLLTELLLGAITEAAQHVVAARNPTVAARRYAAQLRTLVAGLRASVDTTPRP